MIKAYHMLKGHLYLKYILLEYMRFNEITRELLNKHKRAYNKRSREKKMFN